MLEERVMDWLVQNQGAFVAPQYHLYGGASADRKPWAVPDFVALDFKKKVVFVVEVSAADQTGGLLENVRNREDRWFQKLRAQLQTAEISDDIWQFKVLLFLRKKEAETFRKRFADVGDVIIRSLEEIANYWEWDWPSEKAAKEVAGKEH